MVQYWTAPTLPNIRAPRWVFETTKDLNGIQRGDMDYLYGKAWKSAWMSVRNHQVQHWQPRHGRFWYFHKLSIFLYPASWSFGVTLTLGGGRLGACSCSSSFFAFFSWLISSNKNDYTHQKYFYNNLLHFALKIFWTEIKLIYYWSFYEFRPKIEF